MQIINDSSFVIEKTATREARMGTTSYRLSQRRRGKSSQRANRLGKREDGGEKEAAAKARARNVGIQGELDQIKSASVRREATTF